MRERRKLVRNASAADRWFLVGPERSGSRLHIDPLGTSAWNTLTVGRKRWVIFPPDTNADVVSEAQVNLIALIRY